MSNEATAGFRKASTRQFISLRAIDGVMAPGPGGHSAHVGVRDKQTGWQRGGTQPPAPATSGGGPANSSTARHLPSTGCSGGGPIELPGASGQFLPGSNGGHRTARAWQLRPQKPVTSEWERPTLEGP